MINTRLPKFTIGNHALLPIVQGGMGIGVSAHRLAGAVAKEGGVGTIASVELRRLHPDLFERTGKCKDEQKILEANLEALDREIRMAREIAGPKGFIAVNVMKALSHHAELVKQACQSGANAIVMGAGLPFDLPELTEGYDVALIPILSEERGIGAVLKKWLRKGRMPDAIVIEHPRYAGGHLGAPKVEQLEDEKFDFNRVISGALALFEKMNLPHIPLIPAGGINSFDKIRDLLNQGASAVQIGTPFAVTEEGDAHINFKRVLIDARREDLAVFTSAAGLPARAVKTPWLEKYLSHETELRDRACPESAKCPRRIRCLSHCGFKDGDDRAGQFCIENQLAAAQQGNVKRGLFFRGSEALPFGREIRSVRELMGLLLGEALVAHSAA